MFPGRRAVVFVHGCFWHQHAGCKKATVPKTRPEFWIPKLENNRQRDFRNEAALEAAGWRILVVWECQLRDTAALSDRLRDFLGPPGRSLP